MAISNRCCGCGVANLECEKNAIFIITCDCKEYCISYYSRSCPFHVRLGTYLNLLKINIQFQCLRLLKVLYR